jgi:hypothetical protein
MFVPSSLAVLFTILNGNSYFTVMFKRYFWVFKNHLFLLILIIVLVIIATRSTGKTAVVMSTIAGIVMIYAAFRFILWIIKTPAKKDKDEGQ